MTTRHTDVNHAVDSNTKGTDFDITTGYYGAGTPRNAVDRITEQQNDTRAKRLKSYLRPYYKIPDLNTTKKTKAAMGVSKAFFPHMSGKRTENGIPTRGQKLPS